MISPEINPEFETLVEYIKHNRGFDFTGYKRSSLMRRVLKRMETVALESFSDYMDYLEVHPQEFIQLFNTILINVTSFFRDRPTWEYLISELIPRLIAGKQPDEPIRVWSAGCASGEEAYTLAIALAEVLGIEQFKHQVKIYATDIDDEALNIARYGTYDEREVTGIPPSFLEKYFEQVEQRYVFRKDLRRAVIFGRHNLVQDAPISRIDLLVCRNALMYFNSEAQAKILSSFHFALNDGAFLFLGKAEMLLSQNSTFTPIDIKRRIFLKVPKTGRRDRLLIAAQATSDQESNYLNHDVRIREVAFNVSPVAHLAVDLNGCLMLANERSRHLFNLKDQDLSRPLQDLEISYRPLELRSLIDQAYTERRTIYFKDIYWLTPSGVTYYFDVQVVPLIDINSNLLGASITFTDVTIAQQLQADLQQLNQELEMAYEELQSTNEELETTNEELQSSNEELETTNEELQSTNEELETMNEEVQSTNEELQTINDELHCRSDELNKVNDFLESILSSILSGVVVLDRDLHIQIWNYKAEDLWGLRVDEVQGQHLFNLEMGLPIEQLKYPIRDCLTGASKYVEVILNATNRRGKNIECKIGCTPLFSTKEKKSQGVILFMTEQPA